MFIIAHCLCLEVSKVRYSHLRRFFNFVEGENEIERSFRGKLKNRSKKGLSRWISQFIITKINLLQFLADEYFMALLNRHFNGYLVETRLVKKIMHGKCDVHRLGGFWDKRGTFQPLVLSSSKHPSRGKDNINVTTNRDKTLIFRATFWVWPVLIMRAGYPSRHWITKYQSFVKICWIHISIC